MKFEDYRQEIESLERYGNFEQNLLERPIAKALAKLIYSMQSQLDAAFSELKSPNRTPSESYSEQCDRTIRHHAQTHSLSYSEAAQDLWNRGEIEL